MFTKLQRELWTRTREGAVLLSHYHPCSRPNPHSHRAPCVCRALTPPPPRPRAPLTLTLPRPAPQPNSQPRSPIPMATRRRRSPAPTRRAAELIMISRKRGANPTPLDARTLRTMEAVAQHAREGASLAAALRPLPVGANRSSARGCSLGQRGEPPPLECQGEGYNGALASALSASQAAPQVPRG